MGLCDLIQNLKKLIMQDNELNPNDEYKDPIFLFIMNHRLPIIHDKDVTARNALHLYYEEMCISLAKAVNTTEGRFVDDNCYKELAKLIPKFNKVCNDIISVFDLYDKCEMKKVVQTVDNLMEKCRSHLLIQKMSKLYPYSDEESIPGGGIKKGTGTQEDFFLWFRMRSGEYEKRGDLFHVPWDKRDRISSGRYSIEGQPCLYLSSAPQIAWYEMGMPKNASISAFVDLPGRLYKLQTDYNKNCADLNIMKKEAPGHTKEISILEKKIEEINKNLAPLKELESEVGNYFHPCQVLDFTAPFSNRYLPNASTDFVMKIISEYHKAKSPGWKVKPYKTEVERIIYELRGAMVDFPEYSVGEVNEKLISYILMLPIIAACSIVVNDSSAKFKQEYVFSQQILLWVMRQNDIDGIAYRSCSKYEYVRDLNAFDVVLPADDLPIDGVKYSPKLKYAFPLYKPRYIIISDSVAAMKGETECANAFLYSVC